ncbi:hypothetical protein GGX14DRAFT_454189, partial [Mycena pura]
LPVTMHLQSTVVLLVFSFFSLGHFPTVSASPLPHSKPEANAAAGPAGTLVKRPIVLVNRTAAAERERNPDASGPTLAKRPIIIVNRTVSALSERAPELVAPRATLAKRPIVIVNRTAGLESVEGRDDWETPSLSSMSVALKVG